MHINRNEKESAIINKIINDNRRFYRMNEKIRWCFIMDAASGNKGVFGLYDRKNDIINISLSAVQEAMSNGDYRTIEYFVLHEIRHKFQNSIIKDYLERKDIAIDKKIVELWIKENDEYIPAIEGNNDLNLDYFNQDCEIDAYAFAYGVMKYKYNNVDGLYIPEKNTEEFYGIVEGWISKFIDENIPKI